MRKPTMRLFLLFCIVFAVVWCNVIVVLAIRENVREETAVITPEKATKEAKMAEEKALEAVEKLLKNANKTADAFEKGLSATKRAGDAAYQISQQSSKNDILALYGDLIKKRHHANAALRSLRKALKKLSKTFNQLKLDGQNKNLKQDDGVAENPIFGVNENVSISQTMDKARALQQSARNTTKLLKSFRSYVNLELRTAKTMVDALTSAKNIVNVSRSTGANSHSEVTRKLGEELTRKAEEGLSTFLEQSEKIQTESANAAKDVNNAIEKYREVVTVAEKFEEKLKVVVDNLRENATAEESELLAALLRAQETEQTAQHENEDEEEEEEDMNEEEQQEMTLKVSGHGEVGGKLQKNYEEQINHASSKKHGERTKALKENETEWNGTRNKEEKRLAKRMLPDLNVTDAQGVAQELRRHSRSDGSATVFPCFAAVFCTLSFLVLRAFVL